MLHHHMAELPVERLKAIATAIDYIPILCMFISKNSSSFPREPQTWISILTRMT